MSIIVVEGPEKAGKSTLIAAIQKQLEWSHASRKIEVRHWVGRADPDDGIYAKQLAHDTSIGPEKLIAIWDRGWPSEHVYGKLLRQDRRLAKDPWLGEWLHGRAVMANGLGIILSGPSYQELAYRRDKTDLPVRPKDEQALYLEYAERFNWEVVMPDQPSSMAASVIDMFWARMHLRLTPLPPIYCGPVNAKVVIVGESSMAPTPDRWLPFSSKLAVNIGRSIGDDAVKCGWAIAHECPPQALRNASTFIPCGAKAELWVTHYVMQEGGRQEIIRLRPTEFRNDGPSEFVRVIRSLVSEQPR